MKKFLYITVLLSIITYSFWNEFPKGFFYIGNAMIITLLCAYLFLTDKKSNVKFILFSLSLNNLLDELFFDNTKLELNELLTTLAIIIILIIRIKNDRKVQ